MSLAKMVILVLLICLALSAYAVVAEEHVGTASWYWGFVIAGNKFYVNGHYAAMWGVPLGTRVRVTNLENSRLIVVTINDRGPNKLLVAKGRIIDLAAKAFYDLTGSFKSGPIKVKVEILEK
jgi:rare lipoprotein A